MCQHTEIEEQQCRLLVRVFHIKYITSSLMHMVHAGSRPSSFYPIHPNILLFFPLSVPSVVFLKRAKFNLYRKTYFTRDTQLESSTDLIEHRLQYLVQDFHDWN
jgi:hypothetical protein